MGDSYLTSVFIMKICACECGCVCARVCLSVSVWRVVFFKKLPISVVCSNGGSLAVDVESSQAPQVPQVLTTCRESFMWEPQTFTLCVGVETWEDYVSFRLPGKASYSYMPLRMNIIIFIFQKGYISHILLYTWCVICGGQRWKPLPCYPSIASENVRIGCVLLNALVLGGKEEANYVLVQYSQMFYFAAQHTPM